MTAGPHAICKGNTRNTKTYAVLFLERPKNTGRGGASFQRCYSPEELAAPVTGDVAGAADHSASPFPWGEHTALTCTLTVDVEEIILTHGVVLKVKRGSNELVVTEQVLEGGQVGIEDGGARPGRRDGLMVQEVLVPPPRRAVDTGLAHRPPPVDDGAGAVVHRRQPQTRVVLDQLEGELSTRLIL